MNLDNLAIPAALTVVAALVLAYFWWRRRVNRHHARNSRGSYLHCHHVPHEDGTWSIITVRRDDPEPVNEPPDQRRTLTDRLTEWLRKHAD